MQATIWTILCTTYGAWLGKLEISEIMKNDSESLASDASRNQRKTIEYASVAQLEE